MREAEIAFRAGQYLCSQLFVSQIQQVKDELPVVADPAQGLRLQAAISGLGQGRGSLQIFLIRGNPAIRFIQSVNQVESIPGAGHGDI